MRQCTKCKAIYTQNEVVWAAIPKAFGTQTPHPHWTGVMNYSQTTSDRV